MTQVSHAWKCNPKEPNPTLYGGFLGGGGTANFLFLCSIFLLVFLHDNYTLYLKSRKSNKDLKFKKKESS